MLAGDVLKNDQLDMLIDEGASKEVPRIPNPNDKCPCGSGKAYKDCCGKSK
jgi:uncharacterized protein YecA (UPF0149 family)